MSHEGGKFAERMAQTVVRHRALTLVGWVLIALALNAFVPQLEEVIDRASQPVLPDSAESVRAFKEMDREFGGSGAQSVAFVVLVDENGLSPADEAHYANLVKRIRANREQVTGVQDVLSHPEFKSALTSKDGKATYLPVGLSGGTGSPEANRQIDFLRQEAERDKPPGLRTYVTGMSATISDLQTSVDTSIAKVTVVTVVAIGLLLLLIYRSIVTAAIALATIAVALALSRSVTAFLGLHVLDVSTFTGAFLTAIVLGAGTDYSVFLISRYHEERKNGSEPVAAVVTATRKVSAVIAASAATVVAASASMALAGLGVFRTSGPAIAVSIVVTLATALTLTPALLATAGLRGRGEAPSHARTHGLWTRAGALVSRRPVTVLLIGLIVLGALAAFYPGLRPGFDERAVQPASTESNRGYDALAAHFPTNEILPDYVLIKSDHDLRNPRDLAALEVTAQAVAKVPGVETVRGVTRPTGKPIEQASVGHQAGEVGRELESAGDRLAEGEQATGRLADGATQVAGGADRVASGAQQAVSAVDKFLTGLDAEYEGLGKAAAGTSDARAGSRELSAGAGALADGLTLAHDQVQLAVDGLGMAYQALQGDPLCTADPVCKRSRAGIGKIYAAERDELLPGLAEAAAAARKIAAGNGELASGLGELRAGLVKAQDGIVQLSDGQRTFQGKLGELADGAGKLAGGAGKVSDGTGKLSSSTQELRSGLTEAARFLLTTAKNTRDPVVGGFYLPQGALDDPRLALARGYYLSEDGRTARLVVLGSTDPFGNEAIDRSSVVRQAAAGALPGTSLEGSDVAATGPSAINADLKRLSSEDFQLVAIVGLLGVLLILMLLLRSIVAPLYLLASVLLSYASAMGLGVLVWQHLLGHDLEWSVPAIAFIILVAVGADYNILLMSRVREESADGSREGVARAVAATGGVITSAGVIFAVSFLAMMAGSVTTLAQMGFTVGVGLLLDTFVVRTLVVPAIAALFGKANWWPARVSRATPRVETAYEEHGAQRTSPALRARVSQPETG